MHRYVAKYALKTQQKRAPFWLNWTGRFWASDRETGRVNWEEFDTYAINETTLRMILEDQNHPTKGWDVIPKYLFNVTIE